MQFVTSILLAFVAASAPFAMADDGPAQGSVSVSSVTVKEGNYNGCPKGSVSSTIALDNSFLTIIFDRFAAEVGQGVPATQRHVNCEVDVVMKAPGGWKFCAMNADYRGYTRLDANVNGTLKALYSFGRGEEGRIQKNLNGPVTTDFLFHQEGEVANMLWSPCDATTYTFTVKLSVALSSTDRTSTGVIITDSADAAFKQSFHLGWEKCTGNEPSQPVQPGQTFRKTSHKCHDN